MNYAVNVLKQRQEEFEILLETLEGHIQKGAYRTKEELKNAESSIQRYKEFLHDIKGAIQKISV